jgi:Secretion system C-terminal sorting domain/PKD domain
MKLPLRSLLLVCIILSVKAYPQSTPPTIVGPGEYQTFFIKSATHVAYAMGGGAASLGIGSATDVPGTVIPIAFPAGTQIKQISSPLHNGMAVDMNGNVWFWGLNDGGQRGDGTLGGAISMSPVQVTTDSVGNPFTNVNQISSWWNEVTNSADSPSIGTLACKNDGTVWIWGNTFGGMRGSGQQGGYNTRPVQVNIPGNPFIVKVLAGEICMALDNAGNVYTWGGNGRNTLLGTNATDYTTPQKVTLPEPAIDIAGAELFEYALGKSGTLYGWGIYGAYLGIGTGPYLSCNTFQPLPVNLTSDLNLPHPVSQIMCNSVSTHVILTDSTLWGWGDNTQGNVGNGIEINWATYATPYAWDWGAAEVLQNKPVQIEPLVHNFTNMFAGSGACFYMYAEDATGQLYSWGRNKSSVLGNQVNNATSDIQASYPDSWDQPTIMAVNPFANTASTNYLSTCPYCILKPTSYPCSEYTIPTDIPPVSVPGPNQTITLPTTTTILDGTGSHDPDGVVVYYKWREVSGPSANTVLDSTYPKTRISGLVAGTYVYRLTVTDNGWDTTGATMTVIVQDSSGNVAPTVSAGSAQTIQLPTSSVTLAGTATGNNGATISSTAWTEVSGPVTAVIASAAGLSTSVTGLTTAGTYVFQLKATDNNGLSATSTVTITVDAANVAPTVSAGSTQTIRLPTSSVTLTGTAGGNGGATISSTMWTEVSGPATATIAAASGLTTSVTGLTVAGSYVFQLTATDNHGLSATATVTITVDAANVAPTVSAGSDQSIQLPASSVTLSGSATGNGGATISSTAWTEVSGPVTATFSAAANLTTTVSGLTTAGTYVFQLKATDNNGLSATSTVTITVDAANVAPTVSAGSAQTIQLPTSTVTLTGAATGNNGATISSTGWSEVSGPATAVIANASELSTGVTGLTTAGTYVFQLKATDNNGNSSTATVVITVEAAAPPAGTPPTVSAGSDQTIQLPTSSVTLTGTATGNGGATITGTVWTEISGPATATIANTAALSTGVSGLTTAGSYVFELKATDDNGLSTTAAVTITVEAAPAHTPPVADAGTNETVTLPFTDITLNGGGSYDADGTITTYSWVQVSGNGGVTIQGSSEVQPAIYGLTPGVYVFQLTVTDNYGATGSASVTITVDSAAVQAPVANAGTDTSIALPANSVELNGSGSTDPNGEALTYQWSQVSGPGTATLGSSGNVTTTASQLQTGLYVFQLKVTNTSGLSSTATVQVQVINNERSTDSGNAQFTVYPNPVASTLTIKFTNSNTSGQTLIKIIDMKGTALMTQEAEVSGGELINLNVSGLPKGVYALQVIVGSSLSHQLIVKQ